MFKYTITFFEELIEALRRLVRIIDVSWKVIYVAYLTYAIVANAGSRLTNSLILTASIAYFIFDAVMKSKNTKAKETRQARRVGKHTYKITMIVISLFNVASLIYAAFLTGAFESAVAIIPVVVSILGFAISLIFEIITIYVEKKIDLLKESLKADVDELLKPVHAVGDFVKGIAGKHEEKTEAPKSRDFQRLEERANNKQKEKRLERKRKIRDRIAKIKNKLFGSAKKKVGNTEKNAQSEASPVAEEITK